MAGDLALTLATLMTLAGWATALSIGPAPLLFGAFLAAIGVALSYSATRLLYAIGVVTFPLYYVGLLFVAASVGRALVERREQP
jgi:hypothetical protein